jgi:coenzyme F420-reducing hydrogenase beta subunit
LIFEATKNGRKRRGQVTHLSVALNCVEIFREQQIKDFKALEFNIDIWLVKISDLKSEIDKI